MTVSRLGPVKTFTVNRKLLATLSDELLCSDESVALVTRLDICLRRELGQAGFTVLSSGQQPMVVVGASKRALRVSTWVHEAVYGQTLLLQTEVSTEVLPTSVFRMRLTVELFGADERGALRDDERQCLSQRYLSTYELPQRHRVPVDVEGPAYVRELVENYWSARDNECLTAHAEQVVEQFITHLSP